MKTIICIADPNSIHDRKWIKEISAKYKVIWVIRKAHLEMVNKSNFEIAGHISDFSTWRWFRNIKGLLLLRKLIKEHDVQAIHAFYADPNALWAFFKPFLNVKFILTTRGSDILQFMINLIKPSSIVYFFVSVLYRVSIGNTDLISCTSEEQKDVVSSFIKNKDKFQIIKTGLDIHRYNEDFKINLIDGNYILFPRLMKPLYFHEFSIRAIELLPNEILEGYKMVFINSDGDPEYVNKIRNLMNQGRAEYIFLPKLNFKEYCLVLKKASLVVMNPATDGTPVSAFEAVYFNIKVIMGPAAKNNESLKLLGAIMLDWDEIELSRLMQNALQGKGIGQKQTGKEYVEKHFNTKLEMDKLLLNYRKIGL